MRPIVFRDNRYARRSGGMVLILAMVIAAIVLTLGINMTNITSKEIYLASFSGGSETALYAADAALECAEYYNGGDQKVFGRTGTQDLGTVAINCSGYSIAGTERVKPGTTDDPAITTFWIPPTSPPGDPSTVSTPCAFVSITNTTDGAVLRATYSVDGYNTCDANNPRRVQRSLQVNATLSL